MPRRVFLHLYMMRVPLLLLFVLGWLLPKALGSPMLRGLADLQTGQVCVVAFAAFLLLSVALSCSFLVLLYGSQRADGKREPLPPGAQIAVMPQRLPLSKWIVATLYLGGGFLFVRFLFRVQQIMTEAHLQPAGLAREFWLQAAYGTLIGAGFMIVIFLLDLYFSDPRSSPQIEVFALPLAYFFHGIGWFSRALQFVSNQRPLAAVRLEFLISRSNRLNRWLVRVLGPGYGTFETNGNPVEIFPGHRFAGFLAAVCVGVYLYVGHGFYGKLSSDAPFPQEARSIDAVLLQVILLMLLACLVLAAFSFFFDRFRVPVLIPIVLLALFTSRIGSSEAVFHSINRAANTTLPKPAERLADAGDRIIVVAAAGGGIQAAAWTSQVLCGLRNDMGSTFADNVLAISGVSGGSVGTMFYLRCLESPPQDTQGVLGAQSSSLEAIAWGLAHPDLRRAVLPVDWLSWPGADRGWALERALRKNAQFSTKDMPLASIDPQKRWPTVLFNSTEVRTGDPLVFTNSDFPVLTPAIDQNHALHGFHQVYAHSDVLLETAVRMSAAFPYVSPAARLDTASNAEHLVDGGYFDNSGLFTLAKWLRAALPDIPPPGEPLVKKRILILIIDAFPDAKWQGAADTSRAWPYQLAAPADAVLHVRSEGQLVRDIWDTSTLLQLLRLRDYKAAAVTARYVPSNRASDPGAIVDCPQDPPLTWRLTPVEKACIAQEWKALEPELRRRIEGFFAGAPAPPPKVPVQVVTTPIRKGLYWQEVK